MIYGRRQQIGQLTLITWLAYKKRGKMIITETVEKNGYAFTHNYSNENYKIRQMETGTIYGEAYDLTTKNYAYEETDEEILVLDEDVTNSIF